MTATDTCWSGARRLTRQGRDLGPLPLSLRQLQERARDDQAVFLRGCTTRQLARQLPRPEGLVWLVCSHPREREDLLLYAQEERPDDPQPLAWFNVPERFTRWWSAGGRVLCVTPFELGQAQHGDWDLSPFLAREASLVWVHDPDLWLPSRRRAGRADTVRRLRGRLRSRGATPGLLLTTRHEPMAASPRGLCAGFGVDGWLWGDGRRLRLGV